MTIDDVRDMALEAGIAEVKINDAIKSFVVFKKNFFAGMITLEAAYVAGYLLLTETDKKLNEKGLEGLI